MPLVALHISETVPLEDTHMVDPLLASDESYPVCCVWLLKWWKLCMWTNRAQRKVVNSRLLLVVIGDVQHDASTRRQEYVLQLVDANAIKYGPMGLMHRKGRDSTCWLDCRKRCGRSDVRNMQIVTVIEYLS